MGQGLKGKNLNLPVAVAMIVAVIILAAAVGLFLMYPKTESSKIPETSSLPATPAATPETVSRTLLGKSLLVFPPIGSSTEISASDLPKDVAVFIRGGAGDLKIEKIVYADKTTGFHVQYDIPNISFADSFDGFVASSGVNGWQIVMAMRANLFAFLDLKNSVYQSRVSQMLANGTQGEIIIDVLKK